MSRRNHRNAPRRGHRGDAAAPASRAHLWVVAIATASLGLGLALLAAGAGVGWAWYRGYTQDLVPPQELLAKVPSGSIRILDRRGQLLQEDLGPLEALRHPVPLSEISPWLVKATISTEDADFYENPGVNFRGLLRAAYENLFPGAGAGFLRGTGGSSITQQLVKNVYIPVEERGQRSVMRKLKETALAFELTQRFPKDQILEWYLNQIFYGNFAYGAEAAAQRYFGKHAQELTLAEAALLAGIPRAPAYYDPTVPENRQQARERQHYVLNLMVEHGFVGPQEAAAAKEEELTLAPPQLSVQAPHFVFYIWDPQERTGVLKTMCERGLFQLPRGTDCEELLQRRGLRVTTSLDLSLQAEAEAIAQTWVERTENLYNSRNVSIVAIKPSTGEVLAMVGSRDWQREDIKGRVNVALRVKSPGSAIKPITYLAAFLQGWSPANLVWDAHLNDGLGTACRKVENWNKTYYGPMTVRKALGESRNLPACRTILSIGLPNMLRVAHSLGITDLQDADQYGYAVTLGGGYVKLLDITYAFSVLANNGLMKGIPTSLTLPRGFRELDPVTILKVEDSQGRVLYEFKGPQEQAVVPAPQAYLITDILWKDANPWSQLQIGRPAASKTGTPEDEQGRFIGNMVVGYTPDLSVGVWAGNTDDEPLSCSPTGQCPYSWATAGPIWREFMVAAHQGLPVRSFTRPPGIGEVTVCLPSGLLPTGPCPTTRSELFIQGTAPTQRDALWQVARIDTRCGRLATPSTPRQFVEEKVYLMLPPEALKPEDPRPPTGTCGIEDALARITYPAAGALVTSPIPVLGRAAGPGFAAFRLEYGPGPSPGRWTTFHSSTAPVDGSILGVFNPAGLAPGPYTLRLVVMDREGVATTASLTVEVRGPLTPTPAPTPTPTPAPIRGR